MYYKISNGSVTLGANTILEDINFYVKDNDKIGIVGRNGCGKTTLLKAITNEYTLSDGYDDLKIESSNDFKIGYVKQNITDNLNMKMIDYIKESNSDILEIENKLSYARSNYNNAVTSYNNLVESVPSNIIAKIFAFEKKELFKLENDKRLFFRPKSKRDITWRIIQVVC